MADKEVITTTMAEMQSRITTVLRGAKDGAMDKDSLQAACYLLAEIEDMQAALRLLQRGEVLGAVDEDGEVVLRAKDDPRPPKC